MKILIAGDMVPQNRVTTLFDQKKYAEVLHEVKQYTEESDYSIVNLEAPIVVSSNCESIEKVGPNLKTNLSVIGALQYAGFDAVTLANNHLRDYGDWGVNDTLFQLKKAGIDAVGAGLDIQEASVTLYKSMGGGYNCNSQLLRTRVLDSRYGQCRCEPLESDSAILRYTRSQKES